MINRNLLRIKIIQILYSYYKNNKEENDFTAAQNELMQSIDKTYELYHYFFQLIINITELAKKRQTRKSIAVAERELYAALANNRFVKQLEQNEDLKKYIEENEIDWSTEDLNASDEILKQIIASDILKEYMESERSYKEDKELWRNIVKKQISECELLGKELEDMCIYWNDDAEIVLSFVSKTIRNFEEEAGANQRLMPKYRDKEDERFALKLYKNTIYNANEYKELITKHIQNWDVDRVAFLDIIIMQMALAEICSFPSIPVNVSMSEYLELAKAYSTPRSSNFVNGVLDAVVKELQAENKLTKVAYISNYNKND